MAEASPPQVLKRGVVLDRGPRALVRMFQCSTASVDLDCIWCEVVTTHLGAAPGEGVNTQFLGSQGGQGLAGQEGSHPLEGKGDER